MKPWLFLHEDRCTPALAMERDLVLFDAVRKGKIPGALRIYNWTEPAVTTGYNQKSFSLHDRSLAMPVLRRPTGGGAVLHMDDITFSICTSPCPGLPTGILECSRVISRVFASALGQCGLETDMKGGRHEFSPVCFARPSPVELVAGTGKIMGLALARKGEYLLVQGVIPLTVNHDLILRVFGPGGPQGCGGIVEMCPGFPMETFLAGLQESIASHLGISLQDCHKDNDQGHGTDQGKIETRRDDV